MLEDFNNPSHQLRLAMMLDRMKRGDEAKAHAAVAIDSTLKADYDARAAHRVHPVFFAARHEMAEFIVANQEELSLRIERRVDRRPPTTAPLTKVFVYWDKPDTMPAIVRACRDSLRTFVDDGFELIELDEDTIGDHADIPADVRRRLASRPAHFSDYLRSRLLQEHGGLWLDSTCLLTQPLSDVFAPMRDEDAFLFTYAGSRVGSWFFSAQPRSYVLNAAAETEVLWWEKNDHMTNYFMWHDIVEMLYWTDPLYKRAWDSMTKIHPRTALALLGELERPFDQQRFDEILSGSGIHKLTHKLPASAFESDTFAARVTDTARAGAGD